MYTLLKFQGDPACESVWPKQWLFEAIFWPMLWRYRERYLGILKNLQAAHGDSTASPLPPLRRQHANLRHENRESVMQYFGYVVTLVHLGLWWATSCVLVDVQYGIFPLKHDLTRLQQFNTFPEVFCNHRWNSTSKNLQERSCLLIVYSRGECPVFERLVVKTDKIECINFMRWWRAPVRMTAAK